MDMKVINRQSKIGNELANYFCLLSLLILPVFAAAQSHYPGQHTGMFALEDKLKPALYAFDLQDVTLLESRFTQNMERNERWLLSIKVSSLLHSFRTNAGVYSGNEGGYFETKKLAGWESLDCELRGHSTGHILSGLALLYASTRDEKYKVKADSIVAGLAQVQEALNQDGYLSAFPQELINRNMAGKRVWAPWYTIHKIMAGLLDQYLYCNNKQALNVASKMAGWAYKKLQPVTKEQRSLMLRNEFGGINEPFYNLHAITGNIECKWLGDFFYHNEMLDPLKEEKDILETKHANTFIPKLLGLMREYELQGIGNADSISSFFVNTILDHHSFATGSNSDKEHFFKPDQQSKHLTGFTGESCNVYNMLKLARHLFTHTANIKYADYYERALFNHILGQQDPATGMISYFLPMMSGAHKVYSTRDSSFWCCVGSGFENQAKYGEAIYYHSTDDVYVNLFIPSQLHWKERSMIIRQETDLPAEGSSRLFIEAASAISMSMHIRYPYWATSAVVKVNGKRVDIKDKPGSYISLNRKWHKGDVIEINYPMSIHLIRTNDNPDKAAVAYGPIVLAAPLGTDGFKGRQPYSDPLKYNDYYTYNYHVPADINTYLSLSQQQLDECIKPIPGEKLTFKTVKEGIVLKPLYDVHRERYIVYWDIK